MTDFIAPRYDILFSVQAFHIYGDSFICLPILSYMY